MMILWHLHSPAIPAYAHTCNACEADIGCGIRWHCETCYDFDVCDACHNRAHRGGTPHPHPLTAVQDVNVVVDRPTAHAGAGGDGRLS